MRIAKRIVFHAKSYFLKSNFNSKTYWKLRYAQEGNSGDGSYGAHAENKANFVNQAVQEYKIDSVIEFGCGDGNQLKYYKIKKYLGFDLSPAALDMCCKIHGHDSSKSFMLFDPNYFVNHQFINADMVLSSEVIFHLTEQTVFNRYLENLFSAANKMVVIISTNHNDNKESPSHIFHRKFTDVVKEKFPEWERVTNFASEHSETNRMFGEYFHLFVRR